MIRNVGKMTILALALCGAAAVGCDRTNPPSVESPDGTGTINLSLQLAGGQSIQTASYTITGPNGFSRTGAINVSASSKLTATISGIPAGAGFQITISAVTTDGAVTCVGSAKFDVMAGKTAVVMIALTCHEAPRTGSVMVSGTVNICPSGCLASVSPSV